MCYQGLLGVYEHYYSISNNGNYEIHGDEFSDEVFESQRENLLSSVNL